MTSLGLPALALSAVLSAGGLLAPAVSLADSGDQPLTKLVRFTDLDLNTPAGVHTLYHRLERAAREVCLPAERSGSLFATPAYVNCTTHALLTAVRDVDRPLLTAYYAERHGQSVPYRSLISTTGH